MTTRFREYLEGPVETTEFSIIFTNSQGDETTSTFGSQIEYLKVSGIVDVNTANFRSKIAHGAIINNAMEMNVVTTESTGSSFVAVFHLNNGQQTHSEGGSYYRWLSDFLNGAVDKSKVTDFEPGLDIAKLHALANMDPTPYNFAEDLAELSSTVKFLKGKAWKFEKVARRYKKAVKALKRQAKRLKHLSNAQQAAWLANAMAALWLEYRFVLTPLVKSLTDLLEAFNTTQKKRPLRQISRGKYNNETYDQGELTKVNPNNASLSYTSRWSAEEELDLRAGILYEISNPLDGFRFKYGLRNKDIPVTLWNVVRLSFMVDRVINISASIKALTNLADPDLKILTAWSTIRQNYSEKWLYLSVQDTRAAPSSWTLSGDVCKNTEFKYKRDVWIPSVADAVPPIQTDRLLADVTSITDVLALSISFLKYK